MGYRRLFIIRKDLDLSPGKLSAMLMHCVELYYINQIKDHGCFVEMNPNATGFSIRHVDQEKSNYYRYTMYIPKDEYEQYINDIYTKTVCEAKNKSHLLKVINIAAELGLKEGDDYGIIKDHCLTEIKPEEDDGTTIVGVWFRPIPDDVSHLLSKKYQLYH